MGASRRTVLPQMPRGVSRAREDRRICPIVIYPFAHPRDTSHLRSLYTRLSELCSAPDSKYFRPLTVLNRQTVDRVTTSNMSPAEANFASREFEKFLKDHVEAQSEIERTWSVDTCQMWLTGLGKAADRKHEDVLSAIYWVIPGDFAYDSTEGRKALSKIHEIPMVVFDNQEVDLALGEIQVPLNSAKQLIDTYGTYGLLYNWFPSEAQGIRDITAKPRTEFFAISHSYLKHVLSQRWYAYEQMIVILLHAMDGKRRARQIRKIDLGSITDDDVGRSRLEGAMQQVERTERVLKLFWRDRHGGDKDWRDDFRRLDMQSEKVRAAAMIIFEQVLG